MQGLNCCKESWTEDLDTEQLLLSRNEVIKQEQVLEMPEVQKSNDLFMKDVLDTAMEHLTENDIKLSVPCEENPAGLHGVVVYDHKSIPLSF
ncbi:hypothetical protein AMEX_G20243 [Astyanax mexicanus]|uniref:Uncharacterized protein n=1 Tax=Astyanax mexicanus TaxID=7994 RepID=A0A8T2L202_ASTMX|nr:hypothetical protein AMEX_G20243 [Astyanax mexicanus]